MPYKKIAELKHGQFLADTFENSVFPPYERESLVCAWPGHSDFTKTGQTLFSNAHTFCAAVMLVNDFDPKAGFVAHIRPDYAFSNDSRGTLPALEEYLSVYPKNNRAIIFKSPESHNNGLTELLAYEHEANFLCRAGLKVENVISLQQLTLNHKGAYWDVSLSLDDEGAFGEPLTNRQLRLNIGRMVYALQLDPFDIVPDSDLFLENRYAELEAGEDLMALAQKWATHTAQPKIEKSVKLAGMKALAL